MNKWFLIIFAMLFTGLTTPVASSEKQILRHIEALSRDHYYVHIDDPQIPFQARSIVGGEHENEYRILGFQGDKYTIYIESIEGEAGYSLRGAGYERQRGELGDIVTVTDLHTWVSIGVSAHPYAEYVLTVKKNE